jgi:hypothetical protein
MTSTRVEKFSTDGEPDDYSYIFEVLGNKVEKNGVFNRVPLDVVCKVEEDIMLASMKHVVAATVENKPVIIGLGPGRCGTMSLAVLLACQQDIVAHHESEPRLSWDASFYDFISKWASLFYLVKPSLPIVADIANWWLPFVPHILDISNNVRFICLRRNIDEIVESFMLKVPTTSHWTLKTSTHWNKYWNRQHDFSRCFPDYDLPKEEGCRKYVEDYYREVEKWKERTPYLFKIFDIDDLNTEEGVVSILSFCGIPKDKMRIETPHINRTTKKHEEIMGHVKDQFGEDF